MNIHHLTMQDAATQLGYGRNKLFKLLRRQGVLCGNNQPKDRWVRQGYFKTELRQRITAFNQYQPYYVTLVTVAGLNFLRQLIDEQTTTEPDAAATSPIRQQQRQTATPLRRRDRRTARQGATPSSTGQGAGSLPRLGSQSGDKQLSAQVLSTKSLPAQSKATQANATPTLTRSHP